MRKHTLAPHVACGLRGSSGLGDPCCHAGTSVHPPRHPPASYVSTTGGHAGWTCRLTLQPKLVPALAKPLSVASDTSGWELAALLFNLIVPAALLFVFGTKALDSRGTAGRYLCLH